MSVQNVKRILLGTPIPTAQARHERLGPLTGLAIFASDALSSVAYATEEILLILMLAGSVALGLSLPIAVAIAVLIADRRELLPADDPRVPPGGRVLHRHPREPRPLSEPRRRCGAPGGLRPHRRGERRRGHRGDHVGDPAALSLPGDALRDRRGPDRRREPPRRAGVGPALRPAHLPVSRRLLPAGRLGRVPVAPGRGRRRAAAAAGQRRGGADGVPGPPGLLVGVCRADRHRGRLRRGPGLPAPRGPDGSPRPAGPRRHPRRALPGHLRARVRLRRRAGGGGDGDLAARPARLRRVAALLLRPGRDDADPRPGRQHELRGLPSTGLVPRAGPVHSPPVRQPGRPARVLERDHDPRAPLDRAARGLPGEHARVDPALRAGRVPLLHALPGQHGPVLVPAPAARLARPRPAQRDRRAGHRRGGGNRRR